MTMPIDMFVLLFAQASFNSIVVALGIWAVLKLALRIRPGLAAQRAVWLLAQALAVAAFVLVLLPQTARFSVLNGFTFAAAPAGADALSTTVLAQADLAPELGGQEASGDAAGGRWIRALSYLWVLLYGAGLFHAVLRWRAARHELRGLLASASVLDAAALHRHPAFDDAQLRRLARCNLAVLETPAAISPMLIGILRPRLLLPRHLRDFDPQQQQMIVAHELTHWRRRDPWWLCASLLAQTALWFNPIMRKLGARLNWAQEISCDRLVLAGRPQPQRQQYAAALVLQLKLQSKLQQAVFRTPPRPTLAFGDACAETLGARVRLIRQNGSMRPSLLSQCAVAGALMAVAGASILLQPAFARPGDPTPAPTEAAGAVPGTAVAPALPAWRPPLAKMRVNSFFGVPRNGGTSTHGGIDLGAKIGTPILAPVDGTVIVSGDDGFEGNPNYGKVILIQHGNDLRSLYAHLDRRSVKAGDTVKAGQRIGTAGVSGAVSGPHLHFEVMHGGRRIDPERVLAGLDKYGTEAALRDRDRRISH
ncbi:MAG TPA: M23/M56 family metallopeptidase [Paucimonas sp.]|nr:M23/M56 family metallopeptidase [Paucimonas sp.]